MKKVIFLAFITGFFFALSASNTFACTCQLPFVPETLNKQVKKAYKESNAIFSGKVIEMVKDEGTHFMRVKFKIEKSYKSKFSKEVIISTGLSGGNCRYKFEIGKSYLVYTSGDIDNLTTGICQRTSLSSLTKDAEVLDKIKKQKKN